MEEGKILLIGNETDILHCGYSFPLNESGKRYPSAYHYAHSMILTQLGLDEVHILELLATPSANVASKAHKLLQENMPAGHDMNSLAHYLSTSRQSYTMGGLRLRAEQDKRFCQALMETHQALLIVCDKRDAELGIGMDDEEFVAFTRHMRADAKTISQWMREEHTRPREIGQNQLGFFLMWLRYEIREKERAQWMTTNDVAAQGISSDQNNQPIEMSVSDFVIALQGIFQPLSNYYAMNFEIKGETYRSVEHYAYQRLFESMKFSDAEIMKIRTTVKPVDVAKIANKLLKSLQLDADDLSAKMLKIDRWRQSAMKHKITKNELLQQLLLSTGHAILIETTREAENQWTCCTDEFELQHLLTKKYITPQLLIDWMCGRKKRPIALRHFGGNRTGLLLMELRTKLAIGCTHRIPLVSPLETNMVRSSLSNYMICFTPESVLHPFYSCEVKPTPDITFSSPIHCVADAALKFFNASKEDSTWIMETPLGPECWTRLHYLLTEIMMAPLEKIQQWYMTEKQNALKYAMRLQFEQNPQLLRVLLDTGDAFLVACSRFSSIEAELSIGMRERDLRMWLSRVHIDSKSLMDLCVRPMAFRPPYFGGNRIGIILMELRREFILKGVFPQQLPELAISVDAILGSESPMENYVPHYTFDILNNENYETVWANAFLLMAKQREPELFEKAYSKKKPPVLLSIDNTVIQQEMGEFQERFTRANKNASGKRNTAEDTDQEPSHNNENGTTTNTFDDETDEEQQPTLEVMRAVFVKLATSFRDKLIDDDSVQREISQKSKENSRLQEMRRAIEKTREQAMGIGKNGVPNNLTATPEAGNASLPIQPNWKLSTPTSTLNATFPMGLPTNGGAGRANSGLPRASSPRNSRNDDASRTKPHNQLDPFGDNKIPSLLSDFSAAAAAASAAAGVSGISPAAAALLEKNFEKELQKIFPKLANSAGGGVGAVGNNNVLDSMNRRPLLPHYRNYDNRGGRQYGSGSGAGGGGGGRRGGSGNRAIDRSPSPMTAYFQQQQQNRIRGDSPYQQTPTYGGRQQQSSMQQQHNRQQQPPQSSRQVANSNVTSTNLAPTQTTEKSPQPKKPKRVVDESELSEGEILSDDE